MCFVIFKQLRFRKSASNINNKNIQKKKKMKKYNKKQIEKIV